jgi:hypothetical protein
MMEIHISTKVVVVAKVAKLVAKKKRMKEKERELV